MRSTHEVIRSATLAAALTTVASIAAAELPDYIMLERCQSTRDERGPSGNGTWQFSQALVHIRDASGGGWIERHSYQFVAYGYTVGANGIAEYGTGDDVCLGETTTLDGNTTWTVVSGAPDAASGGRALADSPNGTYSGSQNISATIDQAFDLSSASIAKLIFFHHHHLRWSSTQDKGYVEANTGSGWFALDPEDTPTGAHYQTYLGDHHQFKRGEVDLAGLLGQSDVRFRFRFSTSSSANDDGWFIDDVHLVLDGVPVFSDDFESGTDGWTLEGAWGLTNATYPYTSSLGAIDSNGLYTVNPITTPVSIGEGIGFNAIRCSYVEGLNARSTFAKVYHNAPQFKQGVPSFGDEDVCDLTVAVEDTQAPIHQRLNLWNSPNPFNPTTHIQFNLDVGDRTSIRIYDESGRLVRTLLEGDYLASGDHVITWDGRDDRGAEMSSGVYLYRLESRGVTLSRSMILLR